MSDDGDFKKGGFKPAYAVGGLAVAGLIVAFVIIGKKTAETTLRPEEVQEAVRKVLVRPVKEQITEWRKVLDDDKSDERMKQEAVFQLARLRDKESLGRFLKLLDGSSNHATARIVSMAILEFPREEAAKAKSSLEKKFDASNNEDVPQLAAALTYIRDKDYFKKVFEVYRSGKTESAKRVDGGTSFDPEELIFMTDRSTFRGFSKDEKNGVRQLVATVLSKEPAKDDLGTLIELLKDKDIEVSSAASVGIAKLNDASASKELIAKLAEAEKTDNENARKRYIEALKNGIGGAGLVYALKVVPTSDELEARGRYIMEQIRELADPSAADAYKEYLKDESNPAHYRSQIALALADIGDADAVPYLGKRMDQKGIGFNCGSDTSLKCLSNNLGWKKMAPVDADPVTFREQTFSSQYIGDLAVLYPDKKADFLAASGSHIKTFNAWFPMPWLVAYRALVYMGDKESIEWAQKVLKDFKLPDEKLVNLGDDPSCPPTNKMCTLFKLNDFTTATRYIGASKDMAMVDTLTKFLERPKDKKGNEIRLSFSEMELATNPGYRESMVQSTQAAVDGLAEWGPEAGKAAEKLLKLIKDKDHGFFPRLMAGRALGRVASEKDMVAALKEAKGWTDADAKVSVLMAAQQKATPEVTALALDMIQPTTDPAALSVNTWAARVVGWGGAKGIEDKLLKMVEDKDLRVFAALAITLGGDEDLVRRGLVVFEQKSREDKKYEGEIASLRNYYLDTFDSRGITSDDVDSGRFFRFVRNALTMKRMGSSSDVNEAGKTTHEWASVYLIAGLKRLDMNATVPGGMDRLVLRVKLLRVAKSGSDENKTAAVETLKFLKEQGSIMSLRSEAGLTGQLATRAFFEIRHPEASLGAPGDKEKDKNEDKYFSKPKK